ncbi:MAG: hypothetical protein ACI4PM_00240 [Butyricicoccus sp.]
MPEQENMAANRWTAMTTEELEQLLRDDLEQDCLREQDLIEISAVLAQREPSGEQTDVDAAWEEFCSQYRPEEGEETGVEELTDGVPEYHAVAQDKPKTKMRFPRRAGLWAAELAAAAAVFAAVTLMGQDVPMAEPKFPDAQISAALDRQIHEQEERNRTASDEPSAPENTQNDIPYDTTGYGERSLGGQSRQQSSMTGSGAEEEDTTGIMAMNILDEEESDEAGSGGQAEEPTESPEDGVESGGSSGSEAPVEQPSDPSVESVGDDGSGME